MRGALTLVANERVKLTANFLNAIAVAAAVTGGFVPAAGIFYALGSAPPADRWLAIGIALWLVAAGVLHLTARGVLGRLR